MTGLGPRSFFTGQRRGLSLELAVWIYVAVVGTLSLVLGIRDLRR